jgi:hypothetical protein
VYGSGKVSGCSAHSLIVLIFSLALERIPSSLVVALQANTVVATTPTTPVTAKISGLCFFS